MLVSFPVFQNTGMVKSYDEGAKIIDISKRYNSIMRCIMRV